MTPERIERIKQRLSGTSLFKPIPRGNNNGAVYEVGTSRVVVNCFGHEANAEFVSHTQADIADLLAALARAEQALAEIVEAVEGQSVTMHGARFIREIAVQALAAATTTQPPAAASSEGGR